MNKKLTINFLTAFSHIQGTYFRWHYLGMGLVELGHEVRVYCVDYADHAKARVEVIDGLEYHFTRGSRGKQYLGTVNHPFTAIKRIFDTYEPCDVLHVFQPFLSVYIPWKYKLKKTAKVTIFDWDDLWVGGVYNNKQNNLPYKWNYVATGYMEKKVPSLNLPMTTCSGFLRDLANNRGNNNCTIFHNGFWPYKINNQEEARRKINLKSDSIYVGFMGRTADELFWCYEALEEANNVNIHVRLAICGPSEEDIKRIPQNILKYIDYLGNLTPVQTRDFAASLNLGLLPLEDNAFNQSRFPIKFSEYMAAGIPVLCSEVGDMKQYADQYSWVIGAGTNKAMWKERFITTVSELSNNHNAYPVNMNMIKNDLSWTSIATKVEALYYSSLSK